MHTPNPMPIFPLPLSLPGDDIFPPDFPNKIEVILVPNRRKTWSMTFADIFCMQHYSSPLLLWDGRDAGRPQPAWRRDGRFDAERPTRAV